MEISCELITVKEGELESLKGGDYLSVTTTQNSEAILFAFNEFQEKYQKSKIEVSPVLLEPTIGNFTDSISFQSKQKPDLKSVLDFINKKLDITKEKIKGDNLIIQSNSSIFLELPWENIIGNDLYIIRKVVPLTQKEEMGVTKNLLLLMSHSHEGIGSDLKQVMDEEVKSIYESFIENNQSYFRVENILLSKHTTPDIIKKINWGDYNWIHLIMHGDPEGNLCLENNTDHQKYREVAKFSSDDFINLIKNNFHTLIFLSLCYSGGGTTNGENLAYKITKNGYSRYVIAYRDPVGESSAKSFSKFFYENMTTGKGIVDVYKASLKSYYATTTKRDYIPLLYSCV